MTLKKAPCAVDMANNLNELRRRKDLEQLRIFLKAERCFQASVDPMVAIITMEELKRLARSWKLHGTYKELKCIITVLNHSYKDD